jgi:hypothetical protein
VFTRFTDLLKVAAVAVAAVGMASTMASAQNIGDVGQDRAGNYWTYGYAGDGTRTWMKGRHANGTTRTVIVEKYTPTIWTDPDGCEHWVMDDGAEGFMTPHVRPDGRPVCNRSTACPAIPVMGTFTSPHSHKLTAKGHAQLVSYFRQAASSYSAIAIHAHSHVTGTDMANMALTTNQARVVAAVAAQAGARVVKAEGHGGREPMPKTHGKDWSWANKRIEVDCFR